MNHVLPDITAEGGPERVRAEAVRHQADTTGPASTSRTVEVAKRAAVGAAAVLLVLGGTSGIAAADNDSGRSSCHRSCSYDDDDSSSKRSSKGKSKKSESSKKSKSSKNAPAPTPVAAESEPDAVEGAAPTAIALVDAEPTVIAPAIADSAEAAASEETVDLAPAVEMGSGSMYHVVDQIGARSLWQKGITGAGIDVAVIDTGVAPVAALTGADKVVAMVDLSFEAGIPEAVYLDTNGHGTHMAGIIAGSTPGSNPADSASHPEQFQGIAPDAGIVSVKVGDNTGAVDVSQVIAAIDWVVEHRNDGDLNIRVINLSYGTDSEQDYEESPLAFAVERAWHAGIVVVVAAGNDGWTEPGLASPANDPFVIAVGAAEPAGSGFKIPSWASAGQLFTRTDSGYAGYWSSDYEGRYPDVVAPGASIESLLAPGSRIGVEQLAGRVGDDLIRGSGTSQAAAVVSGAAALLLEDRPDLTPDQVKALLMNSADKLPWTLTTLPGSGLINLPAAVASPAPTTAQKWARSTGTGSLEAARGSNHVVIDGVELTGERTVFGDKWDPSVWLKSAAADTTWTGGTFNGSSWTGSSWTGSSWTGSSWTGSSWTGSSWTGSSWTGSSWTGSSWTGSSWTGSSWTGSSWTGSSWTGSSWTGSSWTGSSWTGSSWTGSSWTGSRWTGSSWTDYGWLGVSWF